MAFTKPRVLLSLLLIMCAYTLISAQDRNVNFDDSGAGEINSDRYKAQGVLFSSNNARINVNNNKETIKNTPPNMFGADSKGTCDSIVIINFVVPNTNVPGVTDRVSFYIADIPKQETGVWSATARDKFGNALETKNGRETNIQVSFRRSKAEIRSVEFTPSSDWECIDTLAYVTPLDARGNLNWVGQILDADKVGVDRVTVTLKGTQSRTTQTGGNGSYRFQALPRDGNYTVTPAKRGCIFAPTSITVASQASEFGVNDREAKGDFKATCNLISGRITLPDEETGVSGIKVEFSSSSHETRSVFTDEYGYYSFTHLDPSPSRFWVTPSSADYAFSPYNHLLYSLPNSSINFEAIPNSVTAMVETRLPPFIKPSVLTR